MNRVDTAQRLESPADTLFNGQTLMVTGAGDGIGKALALELAALGAELVLLGRTQQKLEALDDQIRAAGGKPAVVVPCDLETLTEQQAAAIAEGIASECGRLDALIHNAGLLGPRSPVENICEADWNRVMQVNLTAPYLLTRALIPLLRSSGSGRLLFTSSGVARPGRAFWGPYAVSKAGTENLAQLLADELTDTANIRVNCINPGPTRTRMRAAAYPAENPASVPAPDEQIPAYLWLLSTQSDAQSGISYDI